MTPAPDPADLEVLLRRYDAEETYDPDGLSLSILTGLNDARGTQWSQELRLNFDNGGRIRGFIEALLEEELTAVLGGGRYERGRRRGHRHQ